MRLPFAIWTDEGGNSFVEMGFILPILATLLVGSVDISRAYSAKLNLEQAAQRTIEAIQRTEYKTTDNSAYQADAQAAAGTGSSATINAWLECNHSGTHLNIDTGTCNATDTYQRYVQVTITQPFTPMFGTRFFPGANTNGTVTLSATAGVRVQ